MPPSEIPGLQAKEMAEFQRLRRIYLEAHDQEVKDLLIAFLRNISRKDVPLNRKDTYAIALCRTLIDAGDEDAIYVATFITTDHHRETLRKHLHGHRIKKRVIITPKHKDLPKSTSIELHPVPARTHTADPPLSTPYYRHRSLVKRTITTLLSRGRTLVARIPKPWIT